MPSVYQVTCLLLLLLGGHHTDAEFSVQAQLYTVRYSSELLDSRASASPAAGAAVIYHHPWFCLTSLDVPMIPSLGGNEGKADWLLQYLLIRFGSKHVLQSCEIHPLQNRFNSKAKNNKQQPITPVWTYFIYPCNLYTDFVFQKPKLPI